MKRLLWILLLLEVVSSLTTVAFAEQSADISLGKVRMRNRETLDNKARSDVTVLAAKIRKKLNSGVIKLKGDFPGAESAQDYLSKSVLMAREVEKYLKSLLPAKFQVFVTASGYSGSKKAGENSVEITLYPYQLQLQELEALRYVSTQAATLPEEPVETIQPVRTSEPVQPVRNVGNAGMLSPADEDDVVKDSSSKREREKRSSEDAALANELVNKAKARAAEKAKRRASEN